MIKLKIPLFRDRRLEKYDGAGMLMDNQLFLSYGTAKLRYGWDSSLIMNQVGYNYEFGQVLVEYNFWLSAETKESYWKKYLTLGHTFGPHLGFPEWIGRMILIDNEEDIDDRVNKLIAQVNAVTTDLKWSLDHLGTFFPVHYDRGRIHDDLNVVRDPMKFSFKVESSKLIPGIGVPTGCILRCSIELEEKGRAEVLNFDVNVFTPEHVRDANVDDCVLFPPHVIVREINIPELVDYVTGILSNLSARHKVELLFRLSVFTNSFVSKGLLNDLPLESDHQFEVEYFDLRK
jgi:hypothetical protein